MDKAETAKMQPFFIATEAFTPCNAEAWSNYIARSHLTQLNEVVSLDPLLCPTLLPDIQDEYWPHIVNENFMLHFFIDLDFLMEQLPNTGEFNISEPGLPTALHPGTRL